MKPVSKQEAQQSLGSLGLNSVIKHYQRLIKEHDGDIDAVEMILHDHDFFWRNLSQTMRDKVREQSS